MIREMFERGNRMKLVVFILMAIALLGLIYPKHTDEWSVPIEELRQEMNVPLGEVTNLSDRVTALEKRMGDLSNQLAGVRSVADASTSRVGEYESRFEGYDKMWLRLMSDLTTVKSSLAELGGTEGLGDIVADISDLKSDVDALENYFGIGEPILVSSYNSKNGFDVSCGWCPVIGSRWHGQQVVIGNRTVDVEGVKMYLLKREGDPRAITFRIYATNSAGFPTGTPLHSQTFSARKWSEGGKWRVFKVSGCVLSPNRTYALIIYDGDGKDSSHICIGYNYGGTYAGGSWIKSLDGGKTWSTTPTADAGFEIWGVKR